MMGSFVTGVASPLRPILRAVAGTVREIRTSAPLLLACLILIVGCLQRAVDRHVVRRG